MDNCATDNVTTQPYCLSRMYSRPMRERVGLHCKSVKDPTPDWSMRPKFRPRCIRAIALWDPWRSRGPSVFGPLQLVQLAAIFRWALLEADSASPDLLAEFTGRRREEYREGEWLER